MSEIIVAYGSTFGSSEEIAKKIASTIGASAMPMNQINIDNLKKAKFAIFVIGTIGNGQFPSNSKNFFMELNDSPIDLSHLRFALLGLGSRYYQYFCRASNTLYETLKNKGATTFINYVKSDKCEEDGGKGAIAKFILDSTDYIKNLNIARLANFEVMEINEECEDIVFDGFTSVEIIKKECLTDNYEQVMMKYTLKLPDNLEYKTGDLVYIMPENDDVIVDKVLKATSLDGNKVLRIKSSVNTFPEKVSIRQLFKKYIDLNCKPNPDLYSFIHAPYDKNIKTMAEYLIEYPNTVEQFDKFLPLANLIKPRAYSVASERKGELDLIIVNVNFGNYYGLTTHYLQLETTKNIQIKITEGTFEYPSEKSTPIILTALGSGIAPVFSILEHRKAGGFGPCVLFFGIRSRKICPSLIDELTKYVNNGVLSNFFLAISREEEKLHITDLMKQNIELLWNMWEKQETEFYYCGPENDLCENIKSIFISLAVKNGKMNQSKALRHWANHKWKIECF